jgi:16S rRNA C967 or C1407 C5-methylase (RsmB/RsmF family)
MNMGRLSSICDLQKEILLKAAEIVKIGGLIIYSTCSLSTKQNEAVVTSTIDKINKNPKLNYKLTLKPMFGEISNEPLFSTLGLHDSSLEFTKRITPGVQSASAMYIAKLQKIKK